VPIRKCSTMPAASAAGSAPEPVLSETVSVLSLRQSVFLVSKHEGHTKFHDNTLYSFSAIVGWVVCCTAFVMEGAAARRGGRTAHGD